LVKDNCIGIACPDGTLQMLDYQGKVLDAKSLVTNRDVIVQAKADPLPAKLEQPVDAPWWETTQGDLKVIPQEDALILPEKLTTDLIVKIQQPKLEKMQTFLATFTYLLNNPDDRLLVMATCGKQTVTYPFAGALLARPAVVPLRFADGGEVTLTFKAKEGGTLSNGKLKMADASAWHNAAATREDLPPASAPRIKLMVPNVFDLIGDPRAEQVSSGLKDTKLYNCFDKNVLTGTNLYNTAYPQNVPWDGGAEMNLRSAFVLMEYANARTIFGLGLWAMPGDLPIESWTLESCNSYKEEKQMTHVLEANWKLVAYGRGNFQPYSVNTFKPVKAKIWRLTICRSLAAMQNLAEIELYEDIMDTVGEDDEDIAGDF
jgi:hypothetical protein